MSDSQACAAEDDVKTTNKPLVVIVGASFGGLGCWHQIKQQQLQQQQLQQQQHHQKNDTPFRVLLLDQSHEFSVGGTWQFAWTNRIPRDATHHDFCAAPPCCKQQPRSGYKFVSIQV